MMIKLWKFKDIANQQLVTNGELINKPEDQTRNAEWEQRIKQMFGGIMNRCIVPISGAITEKELQFSKNPHKFPTSEDKWESST